MWETAGQIGLFALGVFGTGFVLTFGAACAVQLTEWLFRKA